MKYPSTLLPQSNDPQEIRKGLLDLLDKLNQTADDLTANGAGIIETGTNSNGTYKKFSDGTLICARNYTTGSLACTSALGALFYCVTDQTWTFPHAFIEAPVVSGFTTSNSANGSGFIGNTSTILTPTVWTWIMVTVTSFTATFVVALLAIGKWK